MKMRREKGVGEESRMWGNRRRGSMLLPQQLVETKRFGVEFDLGPKSH